MKKITISRQNKVIIAAGDEHSVEIGRSALEAGLLKQLPGASLAIFLFLTTYLENGNYTLTNPSIIASYLPYDLQAVKDGLNYLSRHGIIKISKERENDYTYRIYLNLEHLDFSNDSYSRDRTDDAELRRLVARKNTVSREELARALTSYIPADKNIAFFRDEVNHWLDDFEPRALQDLIRRVEKWAQNNNYEDSPERGFYYLQGIIDDWYNKGISTYEQVQYYDQLYRETKELAQTYGLNKWQNVNSAQMKTFKSWMTDDFPLSSSVVKYAIKEAIKRKKDGQPSLKYIEENFILPWKKKQIKSVNQARQYLAASRETITDSSSRQNNRQKKTGESQDSKYKWEDFFINFDDFKET